MERFIKKKKKNGYRKLMARKRSSASIPIPIREKAELERRIIDLGEEIKFKDEEIKALGEANGELNSRLGGEEERTRHYQEQVGGIRKEYDALAKEVDELKSAYELIGEEKGEVVLQLKDVQERDIAMRIAYELLLNKVNTTLSQEREERERAMAESSQQIQAQSLELEGVFSRANWLILGYTSLVQNLEEKLCFEQSKGKQLEMERERLINGHATTLHDNERALEEINAELQEKIREYAEYKRKHEEYVTWSCDRNTTLEKKLRGEEGKNFQLGMEMGKLLGRIRATEQEKEALQRKLKELIFISVEDTKKIRKQHQHLVDFVNVKKRFRKMCFPIEERFLSLADKFYFSKELNNTELINELNEQFQEFLETEDSKYHYTALKLAEEMFTQHHTKTRMFYDVLNSIVLLEMPVYQQLRVGLLALTLTKEEVTINTEEIRCANKILTEISKEDPALKLNYNNQVLQTAVYACSQIMGENARARLLMGSYILREQSLKENVNPALLEDARDYFARSVAEDHSLEGALRTIIADYAENTPFELLRTSFSDLFPQVKELYMISDKGERDEDVQVGEKREEMHKLDERYALNLLLNSTEESTISEAAAIAKKLRDEKKISESIIIYEKLTEVDPNNHNHHYFLATTYEQVNRYGFSAS
ncbi:hypothetical protein HYX11_01415 [Candidatus Woesearchaeota archaeon]|nr:hypothetical protein [Candidatus Woesearchaeota archaeon]